MQSSLLLCFKTKVSGTNPICTTQYSYNYVKGLWETNEHSPFVKEIMKNNYIKTQGVTLLTETREGIDRSEGS